MENKNSNLKQIFKIDSAVKQDGRISCECVKKLNNDIIKFLKFLIIHNVYNKFLENMKREPQYHNTLYDFLTENDKNAYISGAFVWSETEEGVDFWSQLNYQWGVCVE